MLNDVIEKTAICHPHHTLYQIFALSNGGQVLPGQQGKARFVIDQDKILAANCKNEIIL